jgi:chaperonin GroES
VSMSVEPQRVDLSIEPLDEYLVVQPVSDESETRAGLILPASAVAGAPCRTGIVTAVGSDATGIEPGDKVMYPRDAGYDVRLGGIEVKVILRKELIARVHDYARAPDRRRQPSRPVDNLFLHRHTSSARHWVALATNRRASATEGGAGYPGFRRGEVAEWLKAAPC